MRKILARLWATQTLLAGFAFPAAAHHSAAMFDHDKHEVAQGTVKSWQWTNPHTWLNLLDAKGAEMDFEMGSPNTLVRNGLFASQL